MNHDTYIDVCYSEVAPNIPNITYGYFQKNGSQSDICKNGYSKLTKLLKYNSVQFLNNVEYLTRVLVPL